MSHPATKTSSEPTTGGDTKALHGVLGLLLLGYAVALVVRANGAGNTLMDGWGTATYELVASVLVLIRAAVSPRDRRFCLALGTGMALGIEQIADAMNHVNEGTSQFLDGAHQSQIAAEKLGELSTKLAAVTERYRV